MRAITIHLTREELAQLRQYNAAMDSPHDGPRERQRAMHLRLTIGTWAPAKLAAAIQRRDETCANPEALP